MLNKYEFYTFNTHGDCYRHDREYVVAKFADLYGHGWEYVDLLEDDKGSYFLFKRVKPVAQNPQKVDF